MVEVLAVDWSVEEEVVWAKLDVVVVTLVDVVVVITEEVVVGGTCTVVCGGGFTSVDVVSAMLFVVSVDVWAVVEVGAEDVTVDVAVEDT